MIPDDVADHFLERRAVVVHDAFAQGMTATEIQHGNFLRPGAADHPLQLILIVNVSVKDDQGGQPVIPDEIVDAAGDVSAVAGPVPVHGGIEHKQTVSGPAGFLFQLAEKIVLQQRMRLGQTDADPLRGDCDIDPVFHGVPPKTEYINEEKNSKSIPYCSRKRNRTLRKEPK